MLLSTMAYVIGPPKQEEFSFWLTRNNFFCKHGIQRALQTCPYESRAKII